MWIARSAAVLLCLMSSAACERLSGPLAGAPPSLAAASAAMQRATGSGQLTIGGEGRTFAFTAVRHADGTVSGEFQVFNRQQDIKAHAELTCLSIVGNQAWMGGVITNSSEPTLEGGETVFRVLDNGEGGNAPPDMISLVQPGLPPGSAAAYCAAMPPFPDLIPVERGNVQVHQ
jgi:hypothetical protein